MERTDFEKLAEVVDAISVAVTELRESGISEAALVLLIQHAAPACGGKYQKRKPTQSEIRAVMDGMEALSEYVFPPEEEVEYKYVFPPEEEVE